MTKAAKLPSSFVHLTSIPPTFAPSFLLHTPTPHSSLYQPSKIHLILATPFAYSTSTRHSHTYHRQLQRQDRDSTTTMTDTEIKKGDEGT
jgi:hypothetical protein